VSALTRQTPYRVADRVRVAGFRKRELEAVVGHPRPCRAAHPVNGEIASAEAGHCHRHRHDTERLARPSAWEDVGALAARGMLGAAG